MIFIVSPATGNPKEPYYKSNAVKDYLKDSRIKLEPLPPYSPNLNLIERFWKFFKKNVLYNSYYERFTEFRDAAKAFLSDLTPHESRLRTLLTDNFQALIITPASRVMPPPASGRASGAGMVVAGAVEAAVGPAR